ncbi:MAG: hypothetical protein IJF80_07375 [Clostridia bacterium]|nr:hypothetical protein [Clostridia bacterium]
MKNLTKKAMQAVTFGTLGVVAFSSVASAYIDPATTSYILQAVAGVVITCGVVLGVFWTKIRTFFRNLKIKSMEKKLTKEAQKKENIKA